MFHVVLAFAHAEPRFFLPLDPQPRAHALLPNAQPLLAPVARPVPVAEAGSLRGGRAAPLAAAKAGNPGVLDYITHLGAGAAAAAVAAAVAMRVIQGSSPPTGGRGGAVALAVQGTETLAELINSGSSVGRR